MSMTDDIAQVIRYLKWEGAESEAEAVQALQARADQYAAAFAICRAVLNRNQWNGGFSWGDDDPICIECDGHKDEGGHEASCSVGTILAEEAQEP